jgi:rubrerythrin
VDTTTRGAEAAPTAEIIDGLNDLLQLDHDAVGAYEIAIEKLKDADHADQIAGFKRDHERHIRQLNELIAELGGTPTNEPHATGPLKQALQSLGAVAGDRGVLIAWRTNELQVRTKYDSYAAKANRWPAHIKRAVDQNALDEERHFDWVTQLLNRMGVPTAEGLETGVATRLREAGTQAEQLADAARAKVAAGASTARNRVADTLDTAADRLTDVTHEHTEHGDRASVVGHRVAGGMHGSARYLRGADLDRVRTDLERSARERPMRTLGILFATGFVIGRLLR